VTVHSNINLIKEGMPGALSVSEIVVRSTERLVALLKAELKILIRKLSDRLHGRTLEQIFIEHRIYKVIENAESLDAAKKAVEKALKPYTRDLERPVTDEDIERLLEIPIKKIARFDVLKNADEIRELKKRIKTETNHLNAIKKFTIQFLRGLIKKHGPVHPRRSRIDSFETVSARDLKDTDSRVYYDRKSGFIGTRVKGESRIDCSSFDKLLLINQKGILKVVPVPDKIFCDKLVHFDVIDKEQVFNLVSRDRKTAACYVKRFRVDKFIQNKEYPFLDPGHRLEAFTAREGMLISAEYDRKIKDKPSSERFPFEDFPVRGPRNRGLKLGTRKIRRVALRSPSR
jgi:topoisomerase-4 subunit A